MSQKLTLSLNAQAIEKAKSYAKSHEISVSKLVEDFFSKLNDGATEGFASISESLLGIAKGPDSELSYKELVSKYKGNANDN